MSAVTQQSSQDITRLERKLYWEGFPGYGWVDVLKRLHLPTWRFKYPLSNIQASRRVVLLSHLDATKEKIEQLQEMYLRSECFNQGSRELSGSWHASRNAYIGRRPIQVIVSIIGSIIWISAMLTLTCSSLCWPVSLDRLYRFLVLEPHIGRHGHFSWEACFSQYPAFSPLRWVPEYSTYFSERIWVKNPTQTTPWTVRRHRLTEGLLWTTRTAALYCMKWISCYGRHLR